MKALDVLPFLISIIQQGLAPVNGTKVLVREELTKGQHLCLDSFAILASSSGLKMRHESVMASELEGR
jgi:hypothetical protein